MSESKTETTVIEYRCACGEAWDELRGAIRCRKCVRYLYDDDYQNRNVIKWTEEGPRGWGIIVWPQGKKLP